MSVSGAARGVDTLPVAARAAQPEAAGSRRPASAGADARQQTCLPLGGGDRGSCDA